MTYPIRLRATKEMINFFRSLSSPAYEIRLDEDILNNVKHAHIIIMKTPSYIKIENINEVKEIITFLKSGFYISKGLDINTQQRIMKKCFSWLDELYPYIIQHQRLHNGN